MAARISKCPRCGKIFAEKPGKTLCAKCNTEFLQYGELVLEAIEKRGLRKPSEIAEFTGVPIEKVIELVENSTLLSHEIEVERMCAACKERPAQKHADYCFHCRLMLNKAFGEAAKLMGQIHDREKRMKSSKPDSSDFLTSVDEALKHKRNRRSNPRSNPTPKNRYSS
jgi:hypothetical protein